MRFYGRYRRYYSPKPLSEIKYLEFQLDGIDADVKYILFNFNDVTLNKFFEAYEHQHGATSANYAVKSFSDWKSGAKKCSAATLKKLIELAPRFFTSNQRFELVKKIHHKTKDECIRNEYSHFEFILGKHENQQHLYHKLNNICSKPLTYSIPDRFTNLMSWLCDGDSEIARNMLCTIEQEYSIAITSAAKIEVERLMSMIRHNNSNAIGTHVIRFPYDNVHITVRHLTGSEKLMKFVFGE
ncbi:hypothetical protein SBF1_830008 [Candidatus Desulfosporosinus infrequens]|uniref:Uncharacterized protein n=1 Tax=Candidatus Desulfosporosinus infrequens TaxID=2043169 RepID=A0A2U3LU32_9FIRM|nr:hypothetical protein SBF1_830008 [Candidatus Desulfosporosinus infrequens]